MSKQRFTRRDFIKTGSAAAAAGAVYLSMPDKTKAADEKKSRVILIRDENVVDNLYKTNDEVINKMLDDAVTILFDESDPQKAWNKIIKPEDIVGIKSNEWGYLRTPEVLEQGMKKRIQRAGVPEDKISIGDRGILSDEVFLNSTALINARPMRTHHWSGVGTLIKNYIMFDENPSSYHPDSCADLGKLWKLPLVKGKTRLNILLMLTPLFHGIGPHHFSPQYVWAYKGMLVGVDPVAVDSIGCKIIQAKRREFFGEERPINPPPKHIEMAETRHHIGNAHPDKIELIKLGWDKDILI